MADVEAQNSYELDLNQGMRSRELEKIKSAGVLTISPELFEKVALYLYEYLHAKLYIQSKSPAVGDFRQRFANPTPLGFMG